MAPHRWLKISDNIHTYPSKHPLSAHRNTGLILRNISIVLRNLVPVDNIPPVGYILWTTVLVLEVVSMLPDIKAKNGEHYLISYSLHQWIVLVRCPNKLQSITACADPYPSTSKDCSRSRLCLELGLHLIKRTKGLVNGCLKLSTWLRFLCFIRRSHLIPEEGVVVVSTSRISVSRSCLKRIQLKFKNVNFVLALGGLVDVGNVGTVVLVVVDFHCRGIDVRFESLEGVEQVWYGVSVSCGWCCDGSSNSCTLLKDVSARVGGLGLHGQG
mmetsp:Transcript_27870/g.47333  ORF Transcript_27870/g.47333 Transcript_27870/m.47333 type:complete len:270 (-) Transcript_27870:98-907(-)